MTTTYGAGGPVDLEDGSLRIFADRGDHHAMLVVPRSVVVAGGGDAVAFVVAILDAMLDELEAAE